MNCFALSLDGYGAGPRQGLEDPLGVGEMELHNWFFPNQTFKDQLGEGHGTKGVDNDFAARGMANVGAWIIGRNMFGPVRGPWPDDEWKGWWGENPPYHVPVFVLTNHARQPIEMAGGTTFHFVTGGMEEALRLARDAAKDKDVRLGGGVATVRAYLRAGLVDEIHLAIAPILLGTGEHLCHGLDLHSLGYRVTEHVPTEAATHVVLARTASTS